MYFQNANSQTDFQQNKDWNWSGYGVLFWSCGLPDRFPTKQGLKQIIFKTFKHTIKSPRPISNKTRIETYSFNNINTTLLILPDRFPTKQGLKPYKAVTTKTENSLPDRFPTKQGLKPVINSISPHINTISQTDFQQNKDWNFIVKIVRSRWMKTPRPISNKTRIETPSGLRGRWPGGPPRPISNKTRIETFSS